MLDHTLDYRLDAGLIVSLWQETVREQPHRSPSAIAAQMGITEEDLLLARVMEQEDPESPLFEEQRSVAPLRLDWTSLLRHVHSLGRIRTVTRNLWAVLERQGIAPNCRDGIRETLLAGDEIQLRVNSSGWRSGFAVVGPGRTHGGASYSFQFFGHDGHASLKIFLEDEAYARTFKDLVEAYSAYGGPSSFARWVHQLDAVRTFSTDEEAPSVPRERLDREQFLAAWGLLQHPEDLATLCARYGLRRVDALRMAEGVHCEVVSPGALRVLLNHLAPSGTPVQVTVANAGCAQTYTGPVTKVMDWRGWMDAVGSEMELHIREEALAAAWLVRTPHRDYVMGKDDVSESLEFAEAGGAMVVRVEAPPVEDVVGRRCWRKAIDELTPGAKIGETRAS